MKTATTRTQVGERAAAVAPGRPKRLPAPPRGAASEVSRGAVNNALAANPLIGVRRKEVARTAAREVDAAGDRRLLGDGLVHGQRAHVSAMRRAIGGEILDGACERGVDAGLAGCALDGEGLLGERRLDVRELAVGLLLGRAEALQHGTLRAGRHAVLVRSRVCAGRNGA